VAARILPFRSLVPSAAKPVLLASNGGPQYALYSVHPVSSKVLTMSAEARSRGIASPAHEAMRASARREIAQGYVHVETTGISVRRFLAVYAVLVRRAGESVAEGVRTLLRPTPAL
jgi:hypothetical protein